MPRLRTRNNKLTDSPPNSRAPTSNHSMSRPRRGAAAAAAVTVSATVNRDDSSSRSRSSSPERKRLRLTVKAAPSKLREATSAGARTSGRGGETRASRNKKVIVEESSEEEEEDEEDEDEDAEGEEDVDMDDEEEDEDAEGEDDDPMDIAPPPAKAVARSFTKPAVKVTPAEQLPSVEAKEIAMGDASDDEELSELDSDEEQELEDEEGLGDDDAEGEEDLGDEDAEGDDDDLDSDDDGTPGSGAGAADLSKLTRRQRAAYDESLEGGLMALSNEAQKKKHLTAEEHAMRRAEMARRRKNLSEKRNEEEKIDTINRLLKRQAPKRRGKAKNVEAREDGESPAEEEVEPEPEKAHPVYTHYVQSTEGVSLAVPQEWLDSPLGSIFLNPVKPSTSKPFSGRMVEEVS